MMDLILTIYLMALVAFVSSENLRTSRSGYSGCTYTSIGKLKKKLTCINITEFPRNISEDAIELEIKDSKLNSTTLENVDLPKNMETLTIYNCRALKTIGRFKKNNLIHLTIMHNHLVRIKPDAFDNLDKLEQLKLDLNYMKSFPLFNKSIMNLKLLSLRGNLIKEFKAEHLSKLPKLKELFLNNNKFKSLKNGMFPEKNNIESLEMSHNPIRSIESRTFENLNSLKYLILDDVDIETLPTKGLKNLKNLSLARVTRLRTIPDGLESIEDVNLDEEKSFLCCKLHFYRIESDFKGPVTKTITPSMNVSTTPNTLARNRSTGYRNIEIHTLGPYTPVFPTDSFNPIPSPRPLNCSPKPTAFQPCEDIMGADWLTAASFIIGPFAVCGNFVVLLVFLCLARNYNVSRFLVTNLALADMTMGIYLLSLVIESVITSGEYYAHVERFQFGVSCKVLGFLAMFSSELSVFSLAMITVERYLTIVYAMYPKYRLTMRTAVVAMIIGWSVSITIAVLPLAGVGSYSKVAICLPFDTENGGDMYLFVVFGINGVGFVFICALYAQIYRSVFRTSNSTPTRGHDSRVARRMAILVFTDFACFTPIAVTAISALLGKTLISVAQSKYLLVFFFPLNGLLNPFLYAIVTKTFRRDLAGLLKNCFVCGEALTNYISTYPGRSVQSTNDVLNRSARPSLDFNATGGFHSLGNIRGSRENPISASFSKSEPNLVKFNQEA